MVAVALALVSQIHNMDIKMVKIFFHSWWLMLLRCWGTSSSSSSSATEWPTRPCSDLPDFLQLVSLPSHTICLLVLLQMILFLHLSIWGCVRLWLWVHRWDPAGRSRLWSSCTRHLPLSRWVPLPHQICTWDFFRIGHRWHVRPGHHLPEPHRARDAAAKRRKTWRGWWSPSFQPFNTSVRWWSTLVSRSPSPPSPTWLPSPLAPFPKSILSSEWTGIVFTFVPTCIAGISCVQFWTNLYCRNFCLFAILCLSFVYLYICTFFLAALAIDLRRIDAGRCLTTIMRTVELMELLLQRRILLLPETRPTWPSLLLLCPPLCQVNILVHHLKLIGLLQTPVDKGLLLLQLLG